MLAECFHMASQVTGACCDVGWYLHLDAGGRERDVLGGSCLWEFSNWWMAVRVARLFEDARDYTERDVNFGPWEDGEVFMNVLVSQTVWRFFSCIVAAPSVEVLCLSWQSSWIKWWMLEAGKRGDRCSALKLLFFFGGDKILVDLVRNRFFFVQVPMIGAVYLWCRQTLCPFLHQSPLNRKGGSWIASVASTTSLAGVFVQGLVRYCLVSLAWSLVVVKISNVWPPNFLNIITFIISF